MSNAVLTDPSSEALLDIAQERFGSGIARSRILWTEAVAAGAFLLLAVLLAILVPSQRSLSLANLALVAILSIAVLQVKFPVGALYTWPAQLVFVPAIFLLPIPDVPLIAAGLAAVTILPTLTRRPSPRQLVGMLSARIGDCWYTVGPVIVLLVCSAQSFRWSDWPVYGLAFVAQVGCDVAAGLARSWFAERIVPADRSQVVWLYATDAALSCVGIEMASCVVMKPGLLLLELPLIGLLALFAHERHARIDGNRELSSAYRGTAMLLGDVIEGDDEYTGAHSRAVVDLSVALADRLGLDAVARQRVEFGALLHDVGKIRVPKEIINKPGKLDDAEWAIMRRHTLYGEQMLARVGGTLGGVGTVVRHSHERWDGHGYPDGIAGPQIPVEARIIAACDAYNAMTTSRPYRPAMPACDANAEMTRCAGSQFDPRVVDALLAELADGVMADEAVPRSPVGFTSELRHPAERLGLARLSGPAGVAQSVRAAES